MEGDSVNPKQEDSGKMQYGCEHYKRRCKIRAPCCNQIFPCRHCHNDATSSLSKPEDRHELVRHDVKQVVCSVCDTEQEVAQVCSNCGVNMGEYFCQVCKFYDDDTEKKQFHCDDCGICRVGGRENFFHCQKCGSCYSLGLRDNHLCVENSMKNYCPICYEYLFDSVKVTTIMKCGHTMHKECCDEMANQNQYRCPFCSKSVLNMSSAWERLDEEIEATSMPEEYKYEVDHTGTHVLPHYCFWVLPDPILLLHLVWYRPKQPCVIDNCFKTLIAASKLAPQIFFRFRSSAMTATILAQLPFTFLGTSAVTANHTTPE